MSQDPRKMAQLQAMHPGQIFLMAMQGVRFLDKLQEAQRLAMGVEITGGPNGTVAGGKAIWNVEVYQPPRKDPDTIDATAEPDEEAGAWLDDDPPPPEPDLLPA